MEETKRSGREDVETERGSNRSNRKRTKKEKMGFQKRNHTDSQGSPASIDLRNWP
jgi:hypothetical protein